MWFQTVRNLVGHYPWAAKKPSAPQPARMWFQTVRNLVGHYPWAAKSRSALVVLVQNSTGKDMRTVRNLVGHYPWAAKSRSALVVLVQNSTGKDMRRGPIRITQNFPNRWMRSFFLLLDVFSPPRWILASFRSIGFDFFQDKIPLSGYHKNNSTEILDFRRPDDVK
ncbi:hypothetical protein QE152_g896 [Popillia japonica]|uniref:Uncharacterized protein n=1 Tax=Popillia japonica TaxID=7064 RepID=A0AAW1NAV0_POPJA